MQFKYSLQPIISILYIFLGIILPPCFCCTGEYKSLFQISFVLSADNPRYLTQNVFYYRIKDTKKSN